MPAQPASRLSTFPLADSTVSMASDATPLPTRISRYRLSPQDVPVDFFADPDGQWEFGTLVEMAGFNPEHPGASVGALTEAFDGYPEGSAVITEVGTECRYVAIALLPNPMLVSDATLPPQLGNAAAQTPSKQTRSMSRSPRAA
jgi:hypothetical protein